MRRIIYTITFITLLISCGNDPTLSEEEAKHYTEQGKKIAEASFKKLSSQLKQAMKSGGVESAIVFCNSAAIPLTNILSTEHGATIKRTSLKLRNPDNAPDSLEKVMLNMYLIMSRMRNPIMVPKILEKNEEEIQFYAPIMIGSEACLKCHGVIGKTLEASSYASIIKHYPKDNAINYRMGEFRGMWSITLKK